jgi:hypothetical protein
MWLFCLAQGRFQASDIVSDWWHSLLLVLLRVHAEGVRNSLELTGQRAAEDSTKTGQMARIEQRYI